MPRAWKMVLKVTPWWVNTFQGLWWTFLGKLRWNRPKTKKGHFSVWPNATETCFDKLVLICIFITGNVLLQVFLYVIFYDFPPSRSLIVYILWPTNTGGFLDPNRRISSLGRLTKTSSASPTPNATTNSAVQKGQLSVTPTASLSLSKPSVRLAYAGTSSSFKLYLKQKRHEEQCSFDAESASPTWICHSVGFSRYLGRFVSNRIWDWPHM